MLHRNVLIPEPKSKPQLLSMCCSVSLERFTVFNREDECEQDCTESGRRHHCLPPVSPYRCRRQAVLDLLFDDVWQQLVGWMKELVQRHWECCTSSRAWISLFLHATHLTYINKCSFLWSVFGLRAWLAADEKISGNLSPVQQDSQNPFMLLSMLPTMLPKVGQSRVPPLTAGLQFQVSDLGEQTGILISFSLLSAAQEVNSKLIICFFVLVWKMYLFGLLTDVMKHILSW